MQSINYLNISVNIISIIAIITIISITVGKLEKRGSKELIVLFSFILIASVTSLLETLFVTFNTKLLLRNLSQIGYFFIPSASFNFVSVYTNSSKKVSKILRLSFFMYALICVILIFTNNLHHIMRVSVILDSANNIKVNQTLIGMIAVSLNTVISLTGLTFLWIFKQRSSKTSRSQILYVFIGFLIPVLLTYSKSAIFGIIGFNLPTSTSFLAGIIFILIGMYKYDFLVITPLARDWVIDEIGVGMVFMDRDNRIVDLNRYARNLPWNVEEVIKSETSWLNAINSRDDEYLEIKIDDMYYSIKTHNLNKKEKTLGNVSLISDITKEKRRQIDLAFKAERDSMTNILNRESFKEKVAEFLKTPGEKNCCLILIDIDKFKTINDSYGHIVGDNVIKKVVTIIKNSCRDSDLVGRLGGDEFIIFIPEADIPSVENLTSRIEYSLSGYTFNYEEHSFYVTLSMGAIVAEKNGVEFKELYDRADKALYCAKESGRARSVIRK